MYGFGNDNKGVYMGEKFKYPVDHTPGPGSYAHEAADKQTKPRAAGGRIHEEQMVYVDVNSLQGASRYSLKARAQSPGIRPS